MRRGRFPLQQNSHTFSRGLMPKLVRFMPIRFPGAPVLSVACLVFLSHTASAQVVAGVVTRPTAMQAAQSATGFTAHNDREQVEIAVCGDSVIHVTARPANSS